MNKTASWEQIYRVLAIQNIAQDADRLTASFNELARITDAAITAFAEMSDAFNQWLQVALADFTPPGRWMFYCLRFLCVPAFEALAFIEEFPLSRV